MKKPRSIKDYRKLFVATAAQRVAEVLYRYPDKEFSLSDLAKEAGVAKPNLNGIVGELEQLGFLKVEKLSKIWRIRANRESWLYVKNKILYNLNFIYQSGLVEYLIQAYHKPKAIVLFGSFRKGEDTSDSDIDLAIEMEGRAEYKILGLRQLAEYERAIRRRIQIHEFSRDSVDIHVFNGIANGIVLYGFLEVKP